MAKQNVRASGLSARALIIGASALAIAVSAASAQAQTGGTPTASSTGSNNTANVNNGAPTDGNSSALTQTGNDNSITVEQVGRQNSSTIQQSGDFGLVWHQRTGDRNSASSVQQGNSHASTVLQQGSDNVATTAQSLGNANSSTILQGLRAGATTAPVEARRNTAIVTQRGSYNASTINQPFNSSAGLEIADNTVNVVQGTQSLLSAGNLSSVAQESRGNFVEVFQFEGGSSALARNESDVTQQHRGAVNVADPSAATLSNNRASISMRGQGNVSSVSQNGINNNAEVTMQSGGGQQDPQTGRRDGNESRVDQSGAELVLLYAVGRSIGTEGKSNLSDVRQTGNMHRAVGWQRGDQDSLSISQQNGGTSGTYTDGSKARAVADVAQRGQRNSATIRQTGDNLANVTQGLGQLSSVDVTQVDAGDLTASANGMDAVNRQWNSVAVAQYGNSNRTVIGQNALKASATVWQRTGSADSEAGVQQGTGATGTAAFAGTFFSGTALQVAAAARDLTASVTQGGTRNSTQLLQDGTGLTAAVEQLGISSSSFSNAVRIAQRGSGNTASARQGVNVGPSAAAAPGSGQPGDELYFAGGARSAELTILQSNSGNVASAEQRGQGQVARIEQSGQNNVASVVQSELATNATALIRQQGNGNSYAISQDQAGQYLSVVQTGNNNAVTSIVRRGPGS